MSTIVFYDIPCKPGISWSPNTLKVRFVLNYKGLDYKTEWVEYPDIQAKCKGLGIGPTEYNQDGSPYYSLPAIYDPTTKTAIADSYHIVRYLDKTYPDSPRVMPEGTEALQYFPLFSHAMGPNTPLWSFALPTTHGILNPRSQEYFRRTREAMLGKKLEDVAPRGEQADTAWKRIKSGYEKLDEFLQLSGGPYMMGQTISYLDISIVSWTLWLRCIFGEDSEKWRDIVSWNGGRWGRMIESFAKYETLK
ncbi:hypothetical protein AX17_006812 [Amanita inopinata Kibby_2008]|nr:hypothetical protein AX17_006812 [Amanita inopinata Kibby_2008]